MKAETLSTRRRLRAADLADVQVARVHEQHRQVMNYTKVPEIIARIK